MLSRHKHKLLSTHVSHGGAHSHAIFLPARHVASVHAGQLMLDIVAWLGNERGITVSKIDSTGAFDEARDCWCVLLWWTFLGSSIHLHGESTALKTCLQHPSECECVVILAKKAQPRHETWESTWAQTKAIDLTMER
jgi:hypothetical protein